MLTIFEGKKLFVPVATLLTAFLAWAAWHAGGYIKALPFVMWPTAHAAFLMFCMAFTASSIQRLRPGSYGKWAMRNRRYIGLNFALIHFVHAGLVLSNLAFTEASRPLSVLAVGGTAYLLLLAMVLTSNAASVKALGAKNWKRLHKVGSYGLLAIFFGTSFRQPDAFTSIETSWLAIAAVGVLALRISAHQKGRKH